MPQINLLTPLTESDTRSLRVGDIVSLNGHIFTGRDRFHKLLYNDNSAAENIPYDTQGGIVFHCGPLINKIDDEYTLISGGPTTSIRLEMYEWYVIKNFGIRGIIGKGGMGEKTLSALKEHGCVYLHTISGAAVYLAERVTKVVNVWKREEFGDAEASWLLEVRDFPCVVTMDSLGNSLHHDLQRSSVERMEELF